MLNRMKNNIEKVMIGIFYRVGKITYKAHHTEMITITKYNKNKPPDFLYKT